MKPNSRSVKCDSFFKIIFQALKLKRPQNNLIQPGQENLLRFSLASEYTIKPTSTLQKNTIKLLPIEKRNEFDPQVSLAFFFFHCFITKLIQIVDVDEKSTHPQPFLSESDSVWNQSNMDPLSF